MQSHRAMRSLRHRDTPFMKCVSLIGVDVLTVCKVPEGKVGIIHVLLGGCNGQSNNDCKTKS